MAQAGSTPPGGIVTDGLILWLDGLQGSKDVWTDKIAGHQFQMTNCIKTPKSYVFQNGGHGICPTIMEQPTTCTLQIAFKPYVIGDGVLFAPKRYRPATELCFGLTGNRFILGTGDSPVFTIQYKADANYTVSGSGGQSLFVNAKEMFSNAIDAWNNVFNKTYTTLGCRYDSPSNLYTGEIYSVRIYNRILTESEVLQNQQYDIDTYFGGVIPE